MKIMKMLACGESWKMARPNGNHANGETGRRICTIGLMMFMVILFEPMIKPIGMAIKLPKPKPSGQPKKLKNPFTITGGLFLGSGLGLSLFVALFLVIQWKLFGYSDPFKFVSTNLFVENFGGGGQLKFIDPITLEVVADLSLVERCSFGRMSLSALDNSDKEDAIVLIGDEFIRQYRWNPVQKVSVFADSLLYH